MKGRVHGANYLCCKDSAIYVVRKYNRKTHMLKSTSSEHLTETLDEIDVNYICSKFKE